VRSPIFLVSLAPQLHSLPRRPTLAKLAKRWRRFLFREARSSAPSDIPPALLSAAKGSTVHDGNVTLLFAQDQSPASRAGSQRPDRRRRRRLERNAVDVRFFQHLLAFYIALNSSRSRKASNALQHALIGLHVAKPRTVRRSNPSRLIASLRAFVDHASAQQPGSGLRHQPAGILLYADCKQPRPTREPLETGVSTTLPSASQAPSALELWERTPKQAI